MSDVLLYPSDAGPDSVTKYIQAFSWGEVRSDQLPKEIRLNIRTLDDVPGYFDFADVYSFMAQSLKRGSKVVEVGSYFGKSVVYLALQSSLFSRDLDIYAVDTFGGEGELKDVTEKLAHIGYPLRKLYDNVLRMFGVEDKITTLEMRSVEAASLFEDGSLAFVFLDADHAYSSVVADIRAWLPKVSFGGILAGHDFTFDDVGKAVSEELPGYERVSWCSWVYRKDGRDVESCMGYPASTDLGGFPSGDSFET